MIFIITNSHAVCVNTCELKLKANDLESNIPRGIRPLYYLNYFNQSHGNDCHTVKDIHKDDHTFQKEPSLIMVTKAKCECATIIIALPIHSVHRALPVLSVFWLLTATSSLEFRS